MHSLIYIYAKNGARHQRIYLVQKVEQWRKYKVSHFWQRIHTVLLYRRFIIHWFHIPKQPKSFSRTERVLVFVLHRRQLVECVCKINVLLKIKYFIIPVWYTKHTEIYFILGEKYASFVSSSFGILAAQQQSHRCSKFHTDSCILKLFSL